MRRALLALVVAAAVAAGLAAAGRGGHADAATASPLAALDRKFRALLPKADCSAVAATVATAKRRRAAALRGARTATPASLRARRAKLRGAIATMRAAAATCAAPPATGGAPGTPPSGGTPAPGTTTGGAPVPPPPAQVLTMHVASGTTFHYTETSATATAGTFRIELHNASDLQHFAGVRAGDGQPTIAESPLSAARGGVVSVDVTLAPGTYQIFCRNNGHDQLGMKIPLTVTG